MISHRAAVKAAAARRRRHNRLILKYLTAEERLLGRVRKVALANEREHAARLAAEASDAVQDPIDIVPASVDDTQRPWRSVAQQINIEALAAEVSEDVGPPTATPDPALRASRRR